MSADIAAKPATAVAPQKKWRRRVLRWLVILALLAVAVRVLFAILLPAAINRVAGIYGLEAEYDRSELSVLSGDAGLWYLKFRRKSGGEPVAQIGYVRGNISVLSLLRLRLDVLRAEADGVDLIIDRTADGRIPLLEAFLAAPVEQATKAPATQPGAKLPLDLSPPLRIEALRLQNVDTRFRDHTFAPMLETRARLDLRLSDLGSPVRPTTLDMSLWTDPGLDLIRVAGEGRSTHEAIDAKFKFMMRGLTPRTFAHYLLPIGIEPQEGVVAAEGRAQVHLKRNAPPAQSVGGQVVFSDVWLKTRTVNAAAAGRIVVDIESLDLNSAKVKAVNLEGGELEIGRSARGNLSFAGLELAGGSTPTTQPSGTAPTPAAISHRPFSWSIDEVRVTNSAARFVDAAVAPELSLNASLSEFCVKDLVFDPARPEARASISAVAQIADLVGSATLSGSAVPFATERTLELDLAATGIEPAALRPYLTAAGLESSMRDGAFSANVAAGVRNVEGRVVADAKIKDVVYRDASNELLTFKNISIFGAQVDPTLEKVQIGTIELNGPTLRATRNAQGTIAGLGVEVSPNSLETRFERASTQIQHASTQVAHSGISFSIPRVEIGRLKWTGIDVALMDAMLPSNPGIGITDAGLEISNLLIDLESGETQATPGTMHGWLAAPGIAEKTSIEGTISSRPHAVALDLRVRVEGLTGAALKPYLKPLLVEPVVEDGNLTADVEVIVSQKDKILHTTARASKVSLTEGQREILGADEVAITDAALDHDALRIDGLTVGKPRLTAMRESSGALVAGGVRLMPATQPTGAVASAPPGPTPPLIPFPLPIPIVLQSLKVESAQIRWNDEAVAPPVALKASADLALQGVQVGAQHRGGRLHVSASAPGVFDQFTAEGTLTLAPKVLSIDGAVNVDGIKPTAIAGYFPAGIEPTLQSGHFATQIEAAVNLAEGGGYGGKVIASGLDYRDGSRQLARVESFRLIVPRFDPPGGVIAVEEIASAGVEAEVEIAADGAAHLLGLSIKPAPQAPSTQPAAVVSLPASADDSVTADSGAIVAAAQKSLPLLTVEKIDLRLDRLTIENRLFADAAPLSIEQLRFHNENRLEWAGSEPEKAPPTRFVFSGRINPLADSIAADATLAPFAEYPTAKVDLSASGINGDSLTKLIPPLAQYVHGRRLTDGRFTTHIDAQLQPDRRGGGPADYSRGFGADISITDVALRKGQDGPVLAGVESLRLEGMRVEPAAGNVAIKTVEIAKPSALIIRDAEGVEAFGMLVMLPGSPTSQPQQAESEPPAPPQTVAPPHSAAQAASAPASPAGGELRIDRVLLSGLDVRVEDRSVDPALVLPLNSLDLDVAGLSNRLATEPRALRFDMVMSAGKVALPQRLTGGLAGAMGDIGALLGGKELTIATQPALEDRELFSQVAASGRISLYPEPKGWAKASVNGLELLALRGFASAAGVNLGGGIFDATVDARLKENGLIETRNRLVFTDLRVSEPVNGPIVRYLNLGAPLDVVIGAVQDPDGSITLPIDVPIRRGELEMDKIIASAVGAVSQVLATAVASAPVKVASGVGGLLGGEKESREPRIIEVAFTGGAVAIEPGQSDQLRQLARELARDRNLQLTLRHELGAGDVALAESRANPSRADLLAIGAQFRRQRSELLAQRAILAGQVRAKVATLPARESAAAMEQLRELDRRIASVESSLDNVFSQLKPGAERQRDRRTRAASLELSRQRLESARDLLISSGPRDAADRVRSVPPQFAPTDDGGGRVVITVIEKKK